MAVPVGWMHAFVDVPAEHVERARMFWAAVTGWAVGEPWAGHPEFVSLEPPDGASYPHVQTPRVEALGARVLWPGDGFVAVADPVGLPFCATGNDPDR